MLDPDYQLLGEDEPAAVALENPGGGSTFFLTCDHASNRIPERLGDLGLDEADLSRHIAWDVGAASVARYMAERLDAPLALQSYSRLVIDCNRTPDRPDAMPTRSEATEIPGNHGLHPAQRSARIREVFEPYHEAIAESLDRRDGEGRANILIAMHSFTPVFHGRQRPWHLGLLYNRDERLAAILKALIAEVPGLCLGDNEPYAISDETDYGIPVHGEQRGIPHIEFEIRHDLIETLEGQREWGARLAAWLAEALPRLEQIRD